MAANSAIRMNGLIQCCLLTIQKDKNPDYEGKLLKCHHCNEFIVFKNNAFEWDRLKLLK